MRAARAASSAWPRCMASNLPSATTVLLPSAARLGGKGRGEGVSAGGERRARRGRRRRGEDGIAPSGRTRGGNALETWAGGGRHGLRGRRGGRLRRRARRAHPAPTEHAPLVREGRGRGRDRETQKHPPALVAARRRRRTSLSRMRALREERRGALSSRFARRLRARLPLGAHAREPRLVGKPHHHGTQQPILEGRQDDTASAHVGPRRMIGRRSSHQKGSRCAESRNL